NRAGENVAPALARPSPSPTSSSESRAGASATVRLRWCGRRSRTSRRPARQACVHRFQTRTQGSLLCSVYSGETVAADRAMTVTVNDVHAQLNEVSVSDVVAVDSLEAIQAVVRSAAAEEKSVAIAGGRHAMGGQQFCSDGVLLDTR